MSCWGINDREPVIFPVIFPAIFKSSLKKIKAILIEDIPGARANPACTFDSFNLKEEK